MQPEMFGAVGGRGYSPIPYGMRYASRLLSIYGRDIPLPHAVSDGKGGGELLEGAAKCQHRIPFPAGARYSSWYSRRAQGEGLWDLGYYWGPACNTPG